VVIQRTKTMTWAIAIVYCLFVFAGESLHLLPGCHHGLVGNNHESGCRSSNEKGRSLVCSHGCSHDLSAKAICLKENASRVDSDSPRVLDQRDECKICKLMAALASHALSFSSAVIQPESQGNVNSCLKLSEVGSAPACLFIRGPPIV